MSLEDKLSLWAQKGSAAEPELEMDASARKARGDVQRGMELRSEFNFGQLAQAENAPARLSGLFTMRGQQKAFGTGSWSSCSILPARRVEWAGPARRSSSSPSSMSTVLLGHGDYFR
jgi:hypothetical protein